jgi:hypothetical protein
MSEINWKSKYQELKMKFMNSVDTAFRLGFEQGMQKQQQQQAQEQAMQQQQMQMAAMQGAPGQEGGAPGEEQPQEGAAGPEAGPQAAGPSQQGSELDQHIAELESMLSKSEDLEVKKSLQKLIAFRKSELQAIELKKSEKAIHGIAKALKVPSSFVSPTASANLNPTAKAALTMQEKIVGDIMKSWEQEEKRASTDIASILANEGLTKKE